MPRKNNEDDKTKLKKNASNITDHNYFLKNSRIGETHKRKLVLNVARKLRTAVTASAPDGAVGREVGRRLVLQLPARRIEQPNGGGG